MAAASSVSAARCTYRARSLAAALTPCFVILTVAFAAADATVSDLFEINIIEPLHRYEGTSHCNNSYDLVRPQQLTFRVNVTIKQEVRFSVVIRNHTEFIFLPGCRKFCSPRSECIVRCNVNNVPDTNVYEVEAASQQGSESKIWICINARDMANVSFIGDQPTDVRSSDGNTELHFNARGFPQPLDYELNCEGRLPLFSPNGSFKLEGLPSGTTICQAIANTSQRINRTEPLTVRIVVSTDYLPTGSAVGTDSGSTGSSIVDSHTSEATGNVSNTLAMIHSDEVNSTSGATDITLISGLLVSCTVLILAASVGFITHARNKRNISLIGSNGGTEPATEARLSSSGTTSVVSENRFRNACRACVPCFRPISIINNHSTSFNHFGNIYEIHGTVRKLVVLNSQSHDVAGSPSQIRCGDIVTIAPSEGSSCETTERGDWTESPQSPRHSEQLHNLHIETDGEDTVPKHFFLEGASQL